MTPEARGEKDVLQRGSLLLAIAATAVLAANACGTLPVQLTVRTAHELHIGSHSFLVVAMAALVLAFGRTTQRLKGEEVPS